MDNVLYKMMIKNARAYLDTFDPTVVYSEEDRRITIFEISEVLAICTCKLKEDVIIDLIQTEN